MRRGASKALPHKKLWKARKHQRRDMGKKLGEILGDDFMETKVGKCFKNTVANILTKKTGSKHLFMF